MPKAAATNNRLHIKQSFTFKRAVNFNIRASSLERYGSTVLELYENIESCLNNNHNGSASNNHNGSASRQGAAFTVGSDPEGQTAAPRAGVDLARPAPRPFC